MSAAPSAVEPKGRKSVAGLYANISRQTIRHRMMTARSVDDRVFWAVVLLSWCGPMPSEYASVRDASGFIVHRHGDNEPPPARPCDLMRELKLPSYMQSNVSKALNHLELKGSIERRDGKIYPLKEPAVPDRPDRTDDPDDKIYSFAGLRLRFSDLQRIVDGPATMETMAGEPSEPWSGDHGYHGQATMDLPFSPEEKDDINQVAKRRRELWLADLEKVNAYHREQATQDFRARGIIIVLNRPTKPISSSSQSSVEETTTISPPDPEPELIPPPRAKAETPPVEQPKPAKASLARSLAALASKTDPPMVWDDGAIRLLRRHAAGRSDAEILAAVRKSLRTVLEQGPKIERPIGYILTCIENLGEAGWLGIREEVRKYQEGLKLFLQAQIAIIESPDSYPDEKERAKREVETLEAEELIE